jgi:uncharacterized protein
MMMRPTDKWTQEGEFFEVLHQHLLWLRDLELRGILALSGPLDLHAWDGTGMSVLRADSYEEAVALSATEPFNLAGLRTNTIHHWQVNEGTINVSVSLLTGKIEVR